LLPRAASGSNPDTRGRLERGAFLGLFRSNTVEARDRSSGPPSKARGFPLEPLERNTAQLTS
uniref:Uncharacterized protein n=1 Tax=Balaenoptera musculus TaxID=9771 RepID=A0A8C0C2Z7_BALMU